MKCTSVFFAKFTRSQHWHRKRFKKWSPQQWLISVLPWTKKKFYRPQYLFPSGTPRLFEDPKRPSLKRSKFCNMAFLHQQEKEKRPVRADPLWWHLGYGKTR
mmetsp:Transcript_48967/g.96575  ORF Transcript_48967/g.96575 Transcript_48967/m.96575 type:complete len:102 (-) Transcript_48967:47-352(-)